MKEEKKNSVHESENLLEISNLHVQYNTDDAVVHALNGLSLKVKKGAKMGLVGETGAGKTTLALSVLRLLPAGVGEITEGSILYDGDDLLKQPESFMLGLRGEKISMIFQDPMTSLNPTHTVGDQILEVLDLHFHEMPKEEKNRKVDEILTLVGIPPARKHEFPHQFSGGMKQRIVIAMALVAEPELLLADEPTTALDVTIQAQILDLLRNLKDKINSSIMLITHDLGVIAEMADYVVVMYAGRVVEKGTVRDIFMNPSHPYTIGLMASKPVVGKQIDRLYSIPGKVPNPVNMPNYCYYKDRCEMCVAGCEGEYPKEISLSDSHKVSCYRFYDGKGEK